MAGIVSGVEQASRGEISGNWIWCREEAAVDADVLAGRERGFIGAEPEHGFGDFGRFAEAAERMHGADTFTGSGVTESAIGHGSFDNGWTDSINANLCGGAFDGGDFGKADDTVFAGDVNAGAGKAHDSGDRRHIDDGTACALLRHLLNFIFEAEEEAFEIDVMDVVPVFLGLVSEGNPCSFDACIVERDVQAAVFLNGFLDDGLNIGTFRDVRLQK